MIKKNRDLKRIVESMEGWSIIQYDHKGINIPNHCLLRSNYENLISVDKDDVINGNFKFNDTIGRLNEIFAKEENDKK